MNRHVAGLLQVAAASICFGFLGIFAKFAYGAGLTIGQLLVARFTAAAVILGLGVLLHQRRTLSIGRTQILLSLGLGFLGYAVFATLYFMALAGLSVALAALLLYTFPFWTLILNTLLGERPSPRAIVGLAGALTGLALLLWGELRVESLAAVACGVGSAIAYAIYIVVSSRKQKNVPALGSGFWIITGAALGLWVFHHPDPSAAVDWQIAQWWPVAGIAVIGTIAPLVLIQAGLQRLSSTETALLSMIEPVTAAVAANFFFQESMSPRQILGGLLVLISLVLVSGRRRSVGPARP